MTNQYFVAAVVAVLLLGAPANAQSAADLLQKGIHAQETVGDVDGAIQIFRQVAASPTANKVLAAQAQYQLVGCMLQKGGRGAQGTGSARPQFSRPGGPGDQGAQAGAGRRQSAPRAMGRNGRQPVEPQAGWGIHRRISLLFGRSAA